MNVRIWIGGKMKDKSIKKYYSVFLSAEDYTTGFVRLTQEEADLVARVTNIENWEYLDANPYSGYFGIDRKHPLTKEKVEKIVGGD